MEMKQAGDSDVRLFARAWSEADRRLKAAWLDARRVLVQAERRLKDARDADADAVQHYREQHGTAPPAGADSRFTWYWLLIALLFIFEFPMNAIVFRLFGENEIFTYVATAAIALALLGSAHFLGVALREGAGEDRTKRCMVVALVALPVLVIGAVAYLREAYLQKVDETATGLSSGGMWFAFATFNLLIFVVATVASYRVHDEPLMRVYRARKKLAEARAGHEAAERRLAHAHTQREKGFEPYQTAAQQVKDAVQRLTEVYRTQNLLHRPDREDHGDESPHPRSFEIYPEVTIPQVLTALEWGDFGDAEDRAAEPAAVGQPSDGDRGDV